MRRKCKRYGMRSGEDPEASMTPMIDVVFQLLIYFLVTFSTADVLAFLDVSRPMPDAAQTAQTPSADMIRITVLKSGYGINGRNVSDKELKHLIGKLATVSIKQTVLLKCDDQSLHGRLVEVLDICASNELTQIAVLSRK